MLKQPAPPINNIHGDTYKHTATTTTTTTTTKQQQQQQHSMTCHNSNTEEKKFKNPAYMENSFNGVSLFF